MGDVQGFTQSTASEILHDIKEKIRAEESSKFDVEINEISKVIQKEKREKNRYREGATLLSSKVNGVREILLKLSKLLSNLIQFSVVFFVGYVAFIFSDSWIVSAVIFITTWIIDRKTLNKWLSETISNNLIKLFRLDGVTTNKYRADEAKQKMD